MNGGTEEARSSRGWDPERHYKETAVAKSYDEERFSSLAGRVFNDLEKRTVVRSFSGIPKDTLILDAPCGTGRLAEALLDAGYRVLGADISAAMLDVAKERLERFGDRFETRVADVRELSKQDSRFDATLCARFLMHFDRADQIEFLQAISKITRQRVVFNQSYSSPYLRLRRRIKQLLPHGTPTYRPIDDGDLREIYAGAELKEIRRHYVCPMVSEAVFFVCEPHD